MKRFWVFILLVASFAPGVDVLWAQSCTALPNRQGELWLAGGIFQRNGSPWQEVAVEGSPGDRFAISFRRVWGGPHQDGEFRDWAGRVGLPFTAGRAGFCLFGGFELNDFDFRDQFDVDHGMAKYLAREIGINANVALGTLEGMEVSAWIAPAVTSLKVEVSGRTLVVDDQISAEERNFQDTEMEFSGQMGLALRWKVLGVSAGIERRPALSSGTLGFLRAGVAIIRNGSGGW